MSDQPKRCPGCHEMRRTERQRMCTACHRSLLASLPPTFHKTRGLRRAAMARTRERV